MPTQTTQKNSREKTRKTEWKRVKLGEVCDFSYGFTASAENKDTGVKLIRITDIVPQLIDWNNVPFCKIEENKLNQFLLKKGDIVVARTGATAGYAKLFRKDPPINSVFASYLIRIKPKTQDLDNFFLGSLIESDIFKSFVVQNAGGAAQPHANAPVLKEFEFLLPPLSKQKKIAEVLSAYDDLIEVNQKKIKTLETLAQTLYKEWFVKPVKDGLPNGWEVKKAEEIISFERGVEPGSSSYSEIQINNFVKFIRVSDLNKEQNIFVDINLCKGKICEENDVLVSFDGSVGLVRFGFNGAYSSGIRKIKSEIFSDGFLYCYMNSEDIQNKIKEHAKGTTIMHASSAIKDFEIIIPAEEALNNINEKLNDVFIQVLNLKKQNQNLQKTRDILIPQLVGGRVEVK